MSSPSPILLVAFSKDQAGELEELSRSMGYSDAHVVAGSVNEIVQGLDIRESPPEYMIIDIGSRGKDSLPLLDDLAQQCEPSITVMVIGELNDVQFYRELKNRGVLEYFAKPVTSSDISATILALKHQLRAEGNRGSVITCMSAASGDGSSTLAMNLAYGLATYHNAATVLVDMDYQFGLISKNLDLTAPFGTRELFEHPDRGVDDLLVQKMLVQYTDNLHIISSPNELRLMPAIKPDAIEELMKVLRSEYDYVIVDMNHTWNDWTAAGLKSADQIMLVGQLWLRSLTHTTRMLTAWKQAGIDRNKIKLIINRSGAKFKEGISAEEFEQICNQSIYAHLNNDIKAVVNAENQGKTMLETAQGSQLDQQFRGIIDDIASDHHNAIQRGDTQGKKGLRGIFDKKHMDKRVNS